MKVKTFIRKFIEPNQGIVRRMYRAVRNYVNVEKKLSYGNENSDKTFYVLGRNWGDFGLMAIVNYSLPHFVYAAQKGYIPVVDIQNYSCQYTLAEKFKLENAWEYYFEQPCGYTVNDISHSKNVLHQNCAFPRITKAIDWRWIYEQTAEKRENYMSFLKSNYNKYIRLNYLTKNYTANQYANMLGNIGNA
jgi:hypothetical protein